MPISLKSLAAANLENVTISDTAPNPFPQGIFWLDSSYLDLYVSYDNVWVMVGTSGQAPEQLNPFLLSGM